MPFTGSRNLDREVARQTGDSLRTIRRYGFSVIDLQNPHFDPEADVRDPLVIDWDDLDAERRTGSMVSVGSLPV